MKLIKVDLCDWDFEKFIKSIRIDKTYLVKIRDDWFTGKWQYNREWCFGSHAWDFDYGIVRTQGNSKNSNELDKNFKEMYEIYDEDLIVKKTIDILN